MLQRLPQVRYHARSILACLLIGLSLAFSVTQASASERLTLANQPETRILELENGSRLFAEINRGQKEKGVFVFVNSLIYDLKNWDRLAETLADENYTVIRYALRGQPEDLKLLADGDLPSHFHSGLTLSDLADDLNQLLTQLDIQKPIHLVGLGYGAAVASEFSIRYSSRIQTTILIAPLVAPSEFYRMNPQAIEKTPEGVNPELHKQSVTHLLGAVDGFDMRSYAPSLRNVYLLTSSQQDQYLTRDQMVTWLLVSVRERHGYIVFDGAKDDLPNAAPYRTAEVLDRIAQNSSEYRKPRTVHVQSDR